MIPVTVVPGDAAATFRRALLVVSRAGAPIVWDIAEDPVANVRRTRRALVGHRRWSGTGLAPAVALRKQLGVFAQHRPIRPLPGLPCRSPDIDVLVVRETTEDVYAHLEHESIPGVFESVKVTTRAACERIATHAFEVARASGRAKVTVAHKSNIMKASDGLFLRVAQATAARFPDIACDEVIVDALCMRLVIDPTRFEVLLCGNLYGDIVSDLCAGLVGGASNAPAIDVAPDGITLFGTGHGGHAEDPLPVLVPAMELLHHAGLDGEADRIQRAIEDALGEGVRPIGTGGTADAATFCEAVEARFS